MDKPSSVNNHMLSYHLSVGQRHAPAHLTGCLRERINGERERNMHMESNRFYRAAACRGEKRWPTARLN